MLGLIAYAGIITGLICALWKYPSVALAGVLCMFGLEQLGQASHPFFSQHQTFTNILMGGILLLGVGIKLLKGDGLWKDYPPVGWLVIGLFIYSFVSTMWAPRPDLSLNIWMSRGPYTVTFLVLTPLVISCTEDLQAAFKALILIGTTLAILLLTLVSWESRQIVLEGGYGNPLAVSEMAGIVALIAILGAPWPSSKIWQIVRWGVVAICLFLVIRSGSRGQLMGLVLVAVVCWPISRRVKKFSHVLLLFGLALFLAAVTKWGIQEFWATPNAYYAGGSRWSEQAMEGAMAGRFEQAFLLMHLWFTSVETVIFGLGNSASFDPRILGIYPHFVPLEILAEEGLIGFGLYVLILTSVALTTARCVRLFADEPQRLIMLGTLVSLAVFVLILSFKQGSLLLNLELFMFAVILGKWEKSLSHSHPVPDEHHRHGEQYHLAASES